MTIGFLYEHPAWSNTLISRFRQNHMDLELINVADLLFNPETKPGNISLAVNRINIMPSENRDSSVVFHTLHYLNWLEMMGIRVVNGSRAHLIGASKTLQNGLFSKLGLHCPRSMAVYRPQDALTAAEELGFPVILKPNIGGSGSGIRRYDSRQELENDISSGIFNLGIDGTGLVQEYIRSDGHVYRIEIIGTRLFYSIRQKIIENTFNYCAADGCSTTDASPVGQDADYDFCSLKGGSGIQAFDADPGIVAHAVDIVRKAGADLGGIEYLMDTRTGSPCFYDFNPYSNFVGNGEALLGFSPEQAYVDFIKTLV